MSYNGSHQSSSGSSEARTHERTGAAFCKRKYVIFCFYFLSLHSYDSCKLFGVFFEQHQNWRWLWTVAIYIFGTQLVCRLIGYASPKQFLRHHRGIQDEPGKKIHATGSSRMRTDWIENDGRTDSNRGTQKKMKKMMKKGYWRQQPGQSDTYLTHRYRAFTDWMCKLLWFTWLALIGQFLWANEKNRHAGNRHTSNKSTMCIYLCIYAPPPTPPLSCIGNSLHWLRTRTIFAGRYQCPSPRYVRLMWWHHYKDARISSIYLSGLYSSVNPKHRGGQLLSMVLCSDGCSRTWNGSVVRPPLSVVVHRSQWSVGVRGWWSRGNPERNPAILLYR